MKRALAVGLVFRATKAFLVVLIFVHLVRGQAGMWPAAGVGLLSPGILLPPTLPDVFTRHRSAYDPPHDRPELGADRSHVIWQPW